MPSRDSASKHLEIVTNWFLDADDATPRTARERVARALADGGRAERAKQVRDRLTVMYSRDELRALAAVADVETKRREGGRPKKKPADLEADLQLVLDVCDVRMQAASRGEHLTDWSACLRLSTLPKHRKTGVTANALYQRLRRAR